MSWWTAFGANPSQLTLSQHGGIAAHQLAIGQPILHAAIMSVAAIKPTKLSAAVSSASLSFVQVSPVTRPFVRY